MMARLFFWLLMVHTASVASAALWYVDNAAAGSRNGTSWANAWTNLNAITGTAAGDTVYISGGTTSKTYRDPYWWPANGTAGNPITYKVGQDSGHNGLAIFDGNLGSTTNSTWLYGNLKHVTISGDYLGQPKMLVTNSTMSVNCDNASDFVLDRIIMDNVIRFNPGTNITLSGVSVKVPALISVAIVWNVYQPAAGPMSYTNNVIRQCSIYVPASSNHSAWGSDGISGGQCTTAVSNLFSTYYVTNDTEWQHGDGWQNLGGSWCQITANTFENFGNYSIYWELFGSCTNIQVHNNVFRNSEVYPNSNGTPVGVAIGPQGVSGKTFSNFIVANNSFSDFFGRAAITIGQVTTTNTYITCLIVNNAAINSDPLEFYNSSASVANTYTNGVFIGYNKSDPRTDGSATFNIGQMVSPGGGTTFSFTSWTKLSAANDLHITGADTAAKDVGFDLSSYFTTDADGNTRSGTWDIGAFEYVPSTTYRGFQFGSGVKLIGAGRLTQ